MYRSKLYPAAASLLIAFSVTLQASAATQGLAELFVVDRSLSDDGLYYCTLRMDKELPIESIGLILYDRQRNKVAEAVLATIDTHRNEKIAAFRLNHELVKFSVVELHVYPPTDDRHERIKFVVGERPARRKQNGKTIEMPIN